MLGLVAAASAYVGPAAVGTKPALAMIASGGGYGAANQFDRNNVQNSFRDGGDLNRPHINQGNPRGPGLTTQQYSYDRNSMMYSQQANGRSDTFSEYLSPQRNTYSGNGAYRNNNNAYGYQRGNMNNGYSSQRGNNNGAYGYQRGNNNGYSYPRGNNNNGYGRGSNSGYQARGSSYQALGSNNNGYSSQGGN
eukprot:4939319-Prymnesium_polylepis.1